MQSWSVYILGVRGQRSGSYAKMVTKPYRAWHLAITKFIFLISYFFFLLEVLLPLDHNNVMYSHGIFFFSQRRLQRKFYGISGCVLCKDTAQITPGPYKIKTSRSLVKVNGQTPHSKYLGHPCHFDLISVWNVCFKTYIIMCS